MGGTSDGGQNQSFHDRLNRVAERRAPIEAAKPEVSAIPDWKDNVKYPATLVAAALLGMFAVFLARYARFHLMGGTISGDDPDFAMIIDGAIAAVCTFALFAMLRFEGKALKGAQTFGIVFMIGVMHNLVHAAPKAFDLAFSEEWTEDILVYSEPGSIYFRGNYFLVLDKGEEELAANADVAAEENTEPALPTVFRLQ